MEKRIGTFYGVSVGPGDPELMTLQAVRRLENCPVIAAPQTPKGGMLALDIAKGAVDLSGKTILPLRFAMSLDPAVQKAAHIEAARAVKEYLDAGQDVAMLNLGDVSVYATFGYLQEILEAEGCKTVMLPGVTSFCAAAARLGQSLTGGMEQPLTIAPGRCAAEMLAAPGAKVLMKSGRQLPETLAALANAGLLSRSAMVCNCGLPNEEVWPDLADYDPALPRGGADAGRAPVSGDNGPESELRVLHGAGRQRLRRLRQAAGRPHPGDGRSRQPHPHQPGGRQPLFGYRRRQRPALPAEAGKPRRQRHRPPPSGQRDQRRLRPAPPRRDERQSLRRRIL